MTTPDGKAVTRRLDDFAPHSNRTGQPVPGAVDAVETPGGLRLRNVRAARIPGAIGERTDTAFELPMYRISPA